MNELFPYHVLSSSFIQQVPPCAAPRAWILLTDSTIFLSGCILKVALIETLHSKVLCCAVVSISDKNQFFDPLSSMALMVVNPLQSISLRISFLNGFEHFRDGKYPSNMSKQISRGIIFIKAQLRTAFLTILADYQTLYRYSHSYFLSGLQSPGKQHHQNEWVLLQNIIIII